MTLDIIETANVLKSLKIGFEYSTGSDLTFHRQLAVSFKEGHSLGVYDNGYEAFIFDERASDMYIEYDWMKLVIAGVADLDEDVEIPLKVVLDVDRTVSFMLDDIIDVSLPIYLYDTVTQTRENLKGEVVNKDLLSGTYTDRFFLVFKDVVLKSNTINKKNFSINIEDGLISVSSEVYMINSLELIEFSGREIMNSKNNQLKYSEKNGVFILKMNTDKGFLVEKIYL